MNPVGWHYEDLEYLNTINIQDQTILSNAATRGYLKLPPMDEMDDRIGRSTFCNRESNQLYFALSNCMIHRYFFHRVPILQAPNSLTMEGLCQSFHSFDFILSKTVVKDSPNTQLPSANRLRLGRSIHYIFYIISIPRITNELYKKLKDKIPTSPISIEYSFGRFFNSKSPAKSLKLYSPIWMDSNDSQFNMWNDFVMSLP